MIKSTTWYKQSNKFETYKFRIGEIVKILVKKNGKPYQVVRFNKATGVIKNPTDN